MTWSPFAAEVLQDPANGHHQLLQQCPVHRCDSFDPPFYTLSTHADITMALRDIDTFSSEFGQGPRFTQPQGMLCDPPQHTHMRKLVQQAFTPKAMAQLRTRVIDLSDQLLNTILQRGHHFDLHDDFAFPLPVLIIAGMLGVPEADLEQFKHWSDVQVAAMGATDPSLYAADQDAFFAYMHTALTSRRQAIERNLQVPDDLLTLIAGARGSGGDFLPDSDAQSILQQLLVGGNETTTSLITNLLWRLLAEPSLYAAVVNQPDLITPAIEESLRYDPPVLGLYRNTTQDVVLHDVTIPKGSKVWLNYAAANRDPQVYSQPDTFSLQRDNKRHLSFGLGVHFCLGAPMARMEAEIALRALTQQMPGLTLRGPGERIAPFFLWGRRSLPVSW